MSVCAFGPILAIDLGKDKSVACGYDRDSGEVAFRSVSSCRDELRHLIQRLWPALVVIAACTFAGWVHDPSTAWLVGPPIRPQ